MYYEVVEIRGSYICLNPYSNGTMYLIANVVLNLSNNPSLNPYSNGTMYLITGLELEVRSKTVS